MTTNRKVGGEMKHIIVDKCGECPYVAEEDFGKDTIHEDCPLMDIPNRDDARGIIHDWFCKLKSATEAGLSNDIEELVDKLGFKQEAK
jgi:hypothetical protein